MGSIQTGGGDPQPEIFTAGAAITLGDLVALDPSGDVIPAISTTATNNFEVVGVALATVLAGASVAVVVLQGISTAMRFLAAPAAASNGDYVFLFNTAGFASLTPPVPPGMNERTIVGVLRGADGITTTPSVQYQVHSL